MPFQLVNDRKTDAIVGSQTKKMWTAAGMPTRSPRVSLSRLVSRL
jgi:hypothetical protein